VKERKNRKEVCKLDEQEIMIKRPDKTEKVHESSD
jgi:hypothetical protein